MALGNKLRRIRNRAIRKGMKLLSEEEILKKMVNDDWVVKIEPPTQCKIKLKIIK